MTETQPLQFIRVFEAAGLNRIPRQLFEQVKGRSWSVERLYRLAPLFLGNNTTVFWVLEDENQMVKGVLWAVIDILSQKLNVIVFSVAEEYRDACNVKTARDFLRQYIREFNAIAQQTKLKETINWVTAEPHILKEIGGWIPKTIMMEV
ncbi:MAG TPA: hypothetical protein VMW23_06310 [Sedimentisphaerales bacterium]|nr:hypothetical protein [Sedimentisphaerales bacterium]